VRTDRSCEATIVTSVQATDRECGPRGWAWSRTQAFVAVEYFFKSPSDSVSSLPQIVRHGRTIFGEFVVSFSLTGFSAFD
jgi:hypothetical protein